MKKRERTPASLGFNSCTQMVIGPCLSLSLFPPLVCVWDDKVLHHNRFGGRAGACDDDGAVRETDRQTDRQFMRGRKSEMSTSENWQM